MKTNKLYKTYAWGFILSLLFTIAAYHMVVTHMFSPMTLIIAILAFAAAQLIVQLYFFLHLGQEQKPRWNLISLLNAIVIILLIVVGSIWIINHLNYNMTPQEMGQHVIQDEGIHK